MGQPPGYAMSSCLLSLRLSRAAGFDAETLREVYYLSLLRHIGCNAETSLLASVMGDEMLFRRDYAFADSASPAEMASLLVRSIRRAHASASAWQVTAMVARGLLALPRIRDSLGSHCEVAQRMAARLGFGSGLIGSLGQVYERWDGKGVPLGLRHEQVTQATRAVTLCRDALVFHRLGGSEAAVAVVRKRKGTAYDPRLADLFCAEAAPLLAGLGGDPAEDPAGNPGGGNTRDEVLAAEPGQATLLDEAGFEAALGVMAEFADVKSLGTIGHSPAVAALAVAAAREAGLGAMETRMLRQAALVCDLGRVSVSSSVWDKAGPLSRDEWDKVRLHAYYAERLLSRSPAMAPLGQLASRHHERLDGTGYHRGLPASALAFPARLLAAADAYQSMREPRTYREALDPEDAAKELQADAKAGRLDRDAVRAVLAAAGLRGHARRTEAVANLSERELEVLRLVARGRTMKEAAQKLSISVKTVDRHIQNIYVKIGVSTRAAAALFAAENHLLD